jgi:DNA repair protein SbcC/Rad50
LTVKVVGSKALGALFLDEGFGTLDPEALDAVAGVLKTIQTQGRMVGIITHVQAYLISACLRTHPATS